MTTAIGVGLLLLILATLIAFVALWRWLTKPSLGGDETVEAMWGIVAALHDRVQRLEAVTDRLERLTEPSRGWVRTLGGDRQ